MRDRERRARLRASGSKTFAHPDVASLVAHWSGNQAAAGVAYNRKANSVGNMIQPTAADQPSIVALPSGNALRFDGQTDEMYTPDVAALRSFTTEAEWCFHLRQNNAQVPTGNTSGTIFAQWGAAERVLLEYAEGGTQSFRPKIATSAVAFAGNNYNMSLATLQAGCFLRVKFRGAEATAADRLRVFVDEVEVARAAAGSIPATLQLGDATEVWLGSTNGANNWGVDIAHAYVFSANLSADEITTVRNFEAPTWS